MPNNKGEIKSTETTKTETVKTAKPKGILWSASIDPKLNDQLVELRFEQRHDKPQDLVRAALTEYAAKYGKLGATATK